MQAERDSPSGSVSETENETPTAVNRNRALPAGHPGQVSGKESWKEKMEKEPETFKWWLDPPTPRKWPQERRVNEASKKTKNPPRKVLTFDDILGDRRERAVAIAPPRVTMPVSKERERVLRLKDLYRRKYIMYKEDKTVGSAHIYAYNELKEEERLGNDGPLRIGEVPGVEVGDEFIYRLELVIVGLHRHPQDGIDPTDYGDEKVASCIVAKEGEDDMCGFGDALVYKGEQGRWNRQERYQVLDGLPDQQLDGGNLALKNSWRYKQKVRVVRGVKVRGGRTLFVYDGLYEVTKYETKTGEGGNMVFVFHMSRCPDQKPVNWDVIKRTG